MDNSLIGRAAQGNGSRLTTLTVGELLVMQINMTISNNKWHQHFNCIRIHCQNYYI
jgi:hypothetical protein